jgi:hypothetical protein
MELFRQSGHMHGDGGREFRATAPAVRRRLEIGEPRDVRAAVRSGKAGVDVVRQDGCWLLLRRAGGEPLLLPCLQFISLPSVRPRSCRSSRRPVQRARVSAQLFALQLLWWFLLLPSAGRLLLYRSRFTASVAAHTHVHMSDVARPVFAGPTTQIIRPFPMS